jgi:hypothetical protein
MGSISEGEEGDKSQRCIVTAIERADARESKIAALESSLSSTVADLLTIAFFWCMRSCEYSLVQGERRTKLLCFRNIRLFGKNNRPIPIDSPDITSAQSISNTFEFQKKEV